MRYRQASPPARGGIRDAGGIRPWAESERERRVLAALDRIDPWVTRAGWLLVLLGLLYAGGHAAVSLL